jgi:hypothetical protein
MLKARQQADACREIRSGMRVADTGDPHAT